MRSRLFRCRLVLLLALVPAISKCQVPVPFDSLTTILEKILISDQQYRLGWDSIREQYGYNSPEFNSVLKRMSAQDSSNMTSVSEILDKYGWLGAAQTSKKANDAIFLVIQHAPLPLQLKYLPMMKEAVAKKKANARDLALLVDRTNMYQGKLQIYGSQLYFDAGGNLHIFPIEDEPRLDKRRKGVGLETMAEYLERFKKDITYIEPKTDPYRNKIIVKGSVIQTPDNYPLEDVSIFLGDNVLIGKSGPGGFFQIVLDEKYRKWSVIFRKENYSSESMTLEDAGKIVYDLNPSLNRL